MNDLCNGKNKNLGSFSIHTLCWLGSMFMVMMYLFYIELFFIRNIAGVFSRKGFPRVKHGVYCSCLFM